MENERWLNIDNGKSGDIKSPQKIEAFLEEIEKVCREYGYSISHEDGGGSFIIEPFDEWLMDWFYDANLSFPADNEEAKEWVEQLKKESNGIPTDETCNNGLGYLFDCCYLNGNHCDLYDETLAYYGKRGTFAKCNKCKKENGKK